MTGQKLSTKFDSGPACRAKATSFRTIAVHAVDPVTKAKVLKMADEWDERAAKYEAAMESGLKAISAALPV
jgi:hypothetical protein